MEPKRYSVVFAGESHAAQLCAVLPPPYVCVKNRAEFAAQTARRGSVAAAFVDVDLLYQVEVDRLNAPIVGILDDAKTAALPRMIEALDKFAGLAHVIAAPMFTAPNARAHLSILLERLAYNHEHAVLGPAGVGRVAMLARASKREARFERIHEFFAKHGLSSRTLSAIHEVCEELVMNALYDAPLEAGYFKKAVPRTQDVELPANRACEISYGFDRGKVFVRVRDPFGALTRSRLLEVLHRCNSGQVQLDESRGGAGLGLWRVFSSASTISMTVIPGQLTDILVEIATKDGRSAGGLVATHLYFASERQSALELVSQDHDLFDQSITLVLSA